MIRDYGETDKVKVPAVQAHMDTAEGDFCGVSEMSLTILEQTATEAENKEVK